ncbi:MAG: YdhR family protein [Actinobacteria bacterium]|nr:YdhR family protein [Actinomycetota bacterium]
MARLDQFPPRLAARSVGLRLAGRVHFPRDRLGEIVPGPGEDFAVLRVMTVDPAPPRPEVPGAVFEVSFRFARFSPAANARLSRIPMPFIAAQPGFRSKTWLIGRETGAFRGVYEWDTVEDAEGYWESFPMRMMRRRAVPDTLAREIRPAR